MIAEDFEEDADARTDSHDRCLVLARNIDHPMSIIIEGPSRTGKTTWARSVGRLNYLSGHLDFNTLVYSNEMDYNVIDEISPDYLKLKHWEELIGTQHDWKSNCKYGKPIQIQGGIPAIVLCNPGEGSSYKVFLDRDEYHALRDSTIKMLNSNSSNPPLSNQTIKLQNLKRAVGGGSTFTVVVSCTQL